MKNIIIIGMLSLSSFFLASCGQKVSVGQTEIGFIRGKSGIKNEPIGPSSFRLPFVPPGGVPSHLINIDTSRFDENETLKLFMPKDELQMDFEVRGVYSVPKSEAYNVVTQIPPTAKDSSGRRIKYVNSREVYSRYADNIVNSTCRALLSQYSIHQVMEQQEQISQTLKDTISAKFEEKQLPIRVLEFTLGQLTPPSVIIEAQETAKKREIKIKEAEADRLVQMEEAATRLEVAKKEQEVDLLEAQTQAEVEQILSKSVNNAFVTQRALKILDALATSDNKVFFMPADYLSDPASMIGAMIDSNFSQPEE